MGVRLPPSVAPSVRRPPRRETAVRRLLLEEGVAHVGARRLRDEGQGGGLREPSHHAQVHVVLRQRPVELLAHRPYTLTRHADVGPRPLQRDRS